MVKNSLAMQEMWAGDMSQKDPLEEEMVTHSSIFAWNTSIPRVTEELDD